MHLKRTGQKIWPGIEPFHGEIDGDQSGVAFGAAVKDEKDMGGTSIQEDVFFVGSNEKCQAFRATAAEVTSPSALTLSDNEPLFQTHESLLAPFVPISLIAPEGVSSLPHVQIRPRVRLGLLRACLTLAIGYMIWQLLAASWAVFRPWQHTSTSCGKLSDPCLAKHAFCQPPHQALIIVLCIWRAHMLCLHTGSVFERIAAACQERMLRSATSSWR